MMNEDLLREKARDWLKLKYQSISFLSPIILHNLKLTVSEFLKRNFSGETLLNIPRYNEMHVEPDIFGIVKLEKGRLGTIIAECKVNYVGVDDFRQALDYARTCKSYEAYLVFYGTLSEKVKARIRSGDNVYLGLNKYGKEIRKKMNIVEYRGNMTFITRKKF